MQRWGRKRHSDCVLTWKLTFCLFSGKWDLILLILEGGGVLCWQLLPSYKRIGITIPLIRMNTLLRMVLIKV